jgi:hypothetical protein
MNVAASEVERVASIDKNRERENGVMPPKQEGRATR